MRIAWIAVIIATTGCDPARTVHFTIAPEPSTTAGDSVLRVEAISIAAHFATKYHLEPQPRDQSVLKCYYSEDSKLDRRFGLNFCVSREDKGVDLRITEAITHTWGLKGDSLRRDLEDTLAARFKNRVSMR